MKKKCGSTLFLVCLFEQSARNMISDWMIDMFVWMQDISICISWSQAAVRWRFSLIFLLNIFSSVRIESWEFLSSQKTNKGVNSFPETFDSIWSMLILIADQCWTDFVAYRHKSIRDFPWLIKENQFFKPKATSANRNGTNSAHLNLLLKFILLLVDMN